MPDPLKNYVALLRDDEGANVFVVFQSLDSDEFARVGNICVPCSSVAQARRVMDAYNSEPC